MMHTWDAAARDTEPNDGDAEAGLDADPRPDALPGADQPLAVPLQVEVLEELPRPITVAHPFPLTTRTQGGRERIERRRLHA